MSGTIEFKKKKAWGARRGKGQGEGYRREAF